MLGLGHVERLQQLIDDVGLIVRIDDERLAQLLGRAGRLAEHQHASSIRAGCQVLLGHQIHAVPQRRDQGHVGQQIKGDQAFKGQLAVEIPDRRPARLTEATVNPTDQLVHLALKLLVFGHGLTRGHADRDQANFALPLRAFFQEAGEGLQPLQDALGEIQAVDRQHDFAIAALLVQLGQAFLNFGQFVGAGKTVDVHAQWEGIDFDRPLADDHPAEIMFEAQDPQQRAVEMAGVAEAVEPNQIGT